MIFFKDGKKLKTSMVYSMEGFQNKIVDLLGRLPGGSEDTALLLSSIVKIRECEIHGSFDAKVIYKKSFAGDKTVMYGSVKYKGHDIEWRIIRLEDLKEDTIVF